MCMKVLPGGNIIDSGGESNWVRPEWQPLLNRHHGAVSFLRS
jgi:hypothetical protein